MGKNDGRKYFMINLHERMLSDRTGIELAASQSPVGCVSDWITAAGLEIAVKNSLKYDFHTIYIADSVE